MTLAGTSIAPPDLLRLVAVPVFAWVAVRDIKTRRVSSGVWIPLAGLGGLLLVWDGWRAWNAGGFVWTHEFLLPAAISLGFVVPIAYLFWWFGGFGGADAKALMVIALLFPTLPTYAVGSWTFPVAPTPIGSLSFTILTNAVVVGSLFRWCWRSETLQPGESRPSWSSAGRSLGSGADCTRDAARDPTGLTRSGLDLDALRMYLRWRGLSLAEIREYSDQYRDPSTLPEQPNPPTDGAVTAEVRGDGGRVEVAEDAASALEDAERDETPSYEDPWGAETFLADIDGSAYGTKPDELRNGLEVLTEAETVWISPGTPFLVPVFVGMVIALVYGDLLIGTVL